jgi:thioredoxin-like negative regulator of GroEL
MAPAIADLARELSGQLKVVKVDVEKNPVLARSFQAKSIPLLVVMQGGQVAGHHMGALDKAGLRALVEPVLPRASNQELKPAELMQLITARRAVPVDLREPGAFARYRIPSALNVPLAEVETRAADLRPVDGRLRVLYARSTDEAKECAEKLAGAGLQVAYLAGGFLHWEADGFEVERG